MCGNGSAVVYCARIAAGSKRSLIGVIVLLTMRAPMSLPYRDFYYPLNVFMHVLTHEEGLA